MIRMRTALDVADNSGAKRLSCISVIGVSGRKTASLADIITASVKEATPGSSVSKGESLRDTVRNIEAMKVDVIVARHSSEGVPLFLARHTDCIIVNAGDAPRVPWRR